MPQIEAHYECGGKLRRSGHTEACALGREIADKTFDRRQTVRDDYLNISIDTRARDLSSVFHVTPLWKPK